MKRKQLVKVFILLDLLIISGVIIYYYWDHEELSSVRNVPVYIMVLALVYILLQIAKRYLFKEYNWWDWLYYIGLTAMMLPTLLATESNLSAMNLLTDFGVLFLLGPVFFDGKNMIQKKVV